MRSSSLARLVLAGLAASVVITLGCDRLPAGPAPSGPFSVLSISPTEGSSAGGTSVVITGAGFLAFRGQAAATVTIDGNRVDATVYDASTIRFKMPAHAAGKVDVAVIGPLGQVQATVPGGYTYVPLPPAAPPVISELLPDIGSTGGGTPMIIRGTGFGWPLTVTIDGIESAFYAEWDIYLSTPAHAAGTVDVIVTNPDGQSGTARFTYVSPATFDFNGDWQGWAQDLASPPGSAGEWARLLLAIRNNIVVSVSCFLCPSGQNCSLVTAPSLTLDPPPIVANGGFSFAGSGDVSITGKILSPISASGSIRTAACGNRDWRAEKK